MDLLDRLLGHDAETTGRLLALCGGLTDGQLDQPHEFGGRPGRSVRANLAHLIRNMEAWTDQMEGRPMRPAGGDSVSELQARLERAAADFAHAARQVAQRDGWDERWHDPTEDPIRERSFGGTIAHLITHSMHHRAQVIGALRALGVEGVPEGDVLSWEAQGK